jgi:hypothetical protein
MSEAEIQSIRKAAAEAALSGDLRNPHPEGSEAARIWDEHFNQAAAAAHS